MLRSKLTKKLVEQTLPAEKSIMLWDSEVTGFGCRISPAGRRSYLFYYRTTGGQQRKPSIGKHGNLTVEQARSIARTWAADVSTGGDPGHERHIQRKAESISQLCELFMNEHSSAHNKPRTIEGYRKIITRFIEPAFGKKKVFEVTRSDVDSLHRKMRETPYQANRVLAVISKMMNMAEVWGLREDGTNPTRHIRRYKEHGRERFLSPSELRRLGEEISAREHDGGEPPAVLAAIRLLIFTGCRLNEILTLQWDCVDFENACIRLPDSKTGSRVIHLVEPAVEVLKSIPREPNNPFVIQGKKMGTHLVNLEKPWRRIRSQAGLEDVRLHDLRHSYASIAVGLGEGLPVIGKLLGHTQAATTQRYAHLAADPLKEANVRVGKFIAEAMGGPLPKSGTDNG